MSAWPPTPAAASPRWPTTPPRYSPSSGWPPRSIEWLAAAQGVDFHRPLATSPQLAAVQARLRADVPFYAADRLFAPDIEAAKRLVLEGEASAACRDRIAAGH